MLKHDLLENIAKLESEKDVLLAKLAKQESEAAERLKNAKDEFEARKQELEKMNEKVTAELKEKEERGEKIEQELNNAKLAFEATLKQNEAKLAEDAKMLNELQNVVKEKDRELSEVYCFCSFRSKESKLQ